MRPVSLRLQAFGSYAGELHVDFARLARHGIFAIAGPTGAGKSTIFDALVYALYDDLPGFRVDGNVRSQFAEPSTPTSVSLDFVVHGERWRVERRPTQLVRRRRGDGDPVERKSTVALGRVGDDGELVPGTGTTRKDEVKRRIDTLVGLTKDQFEQVVLIPQGRFEEVLKADTSRRAPLLRRLFPVDVFTRVTESLKAIASRRQSELDEATRARDAAVDRLRAAYDAAVAQLPAEVHDAVFGPASGSAQVHPVTHQGVLEPCGSPGQWVDGLTEHVERLGEALQRVDGLVDSTRQRSETARARLEGARRAAADWDRWRADVVLGASFDDEARDDAAELAALARARRLADLCGVLSEWEDARRRLGTLEPELAELTASIEIAWPDDLDDEGWSRAWAGARLDAQQAGVLAERLAADARRLDEEIRHFDRLVESGRSTAALRTELEDRRVGLAERALKLDAEEDAVSLVAEEAQRLRADVSSLDALSQAVAALEREQQSASRRAAAGVELDRAEAELARATAAASRATARADGVRSSWRDGLAGRLALLLEEGSPCPTCGALEHPAPAALQEEGADDEELAAAEAERDEAIRLRGEVERRAAAARGAVVVLDETRPLDTVDADLRARREALEAVRDAADRLTVVAAEEVRRRVALFEGRETLASRRRALDTEIARLEADESAHCREVRIFVDAHGAFDSPAPRAVARVELAAGVGRLADVLKEVECAQAVLRHCGAVVDPVACELGVSDPRELRSSLLDPDEIDARSSALDARRSRREEVRRRIAEYEAQAGAAGVLERPEIGALEASAKAAVDEHVALVERRAVLADRAAVLVAGPEEIAEAATAVATARRALEQARTIAERCAGLGGGPAPSRLSLENWVLADYLRQVLAQANHRLDAMTDGRFSLQLSDGVTDGRKPWGLDLSVFDANTGQVRPATTLSGGETFMAALALALGLADVVSGGSNREVGALFVDEGFGSLDPQSLDAVIEVLRSLEDGGRIVGIISHVRELQQALPSGITVEPSSRGSLATLHYPPE